MQKVFLNGNVGQAAQLRQTPGGQSVASFSLAVNEYVGRNEQGEAQTRTTWFTCTMWGKYAEAMAPHIKKDTQTGKFPNLTVMGELTYNKPYQRQDGSWARSNEVRVDKVVFSGMNEMILVGNVGRDAQLRQTRSGTSVVNFSLAVNKRLPATETAEAREITTWFNVVVWGAMAEAYAPHITQGRMITVHGFYKETQPFIGQDGVPRVNLEVTARQIEFCGANPNGSSAQGEQEYVDDPLLEAGLDLGGELLDDDDVETLF